MPRKSANVVSMDRNPVPLTTGGNTAQPLQAPRINLTLTKAESGQAIVRVGLVEFIAYSQNTGFTRLNLNGGRVLDVKETTDQIDRLVRSASGQGHLLPIKHTGSESA